MTLGKKKKIQITFIAFAAIAILSCSNNDDAQNLQRPPGYSCSNGSSSSLSSSVGISSSSGYDSLSYQGKTYKTVKIGSQIWMAENLNYDVSGSKCYDNKEINCDKYGRLYDWATAMGIEAKYNSKELGESDVKHQGICPSGWHIPSDDDWEILMDYVGWPAGTQLKANIGWNENGSGTDAYGFSALPGGGGYSSGNFYYAGDDGYWWSASEYNSDVANRIYMSYLNEDVFWYGYYKMLLLSVRCLQDF